jgi:hypothetical protein
MFYGEIRSYTERIWHVYGRKRSYTTVYRVRNRRPGTHCQQTDCFKDFLENHARTITHLTIVTDVNSYSSSHFTTLCLALSCFNDLILFDIGSCSRVQVISIRRFSHKMYVFILLDGLASFCSIFTIDRTFEYIRLSYGILVQFTIIKCSTR